MSLGAILVGIAVAMVVSTYIAQPFRRVIANPDDIIETWIKRQGQLAVPSPLPTTPTPTPPSPAETLNATPASVRATHESPPGTQINFCPQCGRKVAPDHRFCPGCGYKLPREEVEA